MQRRKEKERGETKRLKQRVQKREIQMQGNQKINRQAHVHIHVHTETEKDSETPRGQLREKDGQRKKARDEPREGGKRWDESRRKEGSEGVQNQKTWG